MCWKCRAKTSGWNWKALSTGASHQPYLMAGTVRFDFQGYYMMAAMHVGICLLLGVLVWLFLKGTKKLREKTAVG